MDKVKVTFMLVLATWMIGCLLAILYSRDLAIFILEYTK